MVGCGSSMGSSVVWGWVGEDGSELDVVGFGSVVEVVLEGFEEESGPYFSDFSSDSITFSSTWFSSRSSLPRSCNSFLINGLVY